MMRNQGYAAIGWWNRKSDPGIVLYRESAKPEIRRTGIRPMKSGSLLIAAAALLIGGGSVAQATVGFTTLNDPSDTGGYLIASGINNSGEVVGSYQDSGSVLHGFYLTGGSYTSVDVPSSASTVASGVNNAGLITGYYTDLTANAGVHGFTGPSGGSYTGFNNPNAASIGATYGSATNDSSTTVGYYNDNTTGAQHAFVGGTTVNYLSATSTQALGINDAGTVVGTYTDGTSGLQNGFIDVAGTLAQLDDPNGTYGTVATGIDSRGDVVGYYIDGGGVTDGFVDVLGVGFITVNDPNADGTSEVLGVNDNDQIVGMYVASDGNTYGFVAYDSDLPEPGTFVLFGLATLGIVTLHRRRILGI